MNEWMNGSHGIPCGWADIKKLIVAFRNFANATEIHSWYCAYINVPLYQLSYESVTSESFHAKEMCIAQMFNETKCAKCSLKSRKARIGFFSPAVSTRLSLDGFLWNFILEVLWKSFKKILTDLKSYKNIRHFTGRLKQVHIVDSSTKYFVAQ